MRVLILMLILRRYGVGGVLLKVLRGLVFRWLMGLRVWIRVLQGLIFRCLRILFLGGERRRVIFLRLVRVLSPNGMVSGALGPLV